MWGIFGTGWTAAKGRGTLLASVVVAALLLAGCSGTPDASGSWSITVPVAAGNTDEPREGTMVYDVQLQQAEDGGLTGTASGTANGSSCNYEILGPANVSGTSMPASRVTEQGDVTLNFEGGCDEDASWLDTDFVLSGQINGDEMSGQARDALSAAEATEGIPDAVAFADTEDLYAPAIGEWTATRGSGEAAEPNLGSSGASGGSDAGEETVMSSHGDLAAAEDTGAATADEARAAVRHFSDLEWETSGKVEDLEGRISTLEEPQASLGEALGPDTQDPSTFDCASDPPSCVAAALEDYLEQDRATFEEEGFGPAGCEAANGGETYTDYEDFDATGGETYITEREQINEAADGLTEYARDTLAQVRETEAAYNEAQRKTEEANTTMGTVTLSYRPSEVEPLVEEASEAQERAEEALPAANERYEGYKSRANAAIAEAEALYARAGCAIEETQS